MPSILSLDAGQWQQTQLPVGPQSHWYSETANTLTTILYPYNHSVLHFQYGIQYITWSIQYFIKNRLCVQLFLPNCRLMWVFYARLRWVQLNCDVWWIMCVCSVAQPYLTLWHPMNCSLLGSSVHGIFQARILAVLSCFSHVWLFVTPWTVACQAPLSMGFSRQEYCYFLLQGIFPTQESNPHLLHWQKDSLPLAQPEKPTQWIRCVKCIFDLQYFQLMMSLSGYNYIIGQGRSIPHCL